MGYIALFVGWLAVAAVISIGWVLNILNILAVESFTSVTGELILQLIGIVIVPLGALMGYIV